MRMEILGLPIACATANLPPRSEHRLPPDNNAKTRRLGLIGSAEPLDGQIVSLLQSGLKSDGRSDTD